MNNVLRRVYVLRYEAALGNYDGVIAAEQGCESCTADDIFVYRIAGFMAARRGGTDEQVPTAASALREFTEEWLAKSVDKISMGIDVSFLLDPCSPDFVEWLLGGPRPPVSKLASMPGSQTTPVTGRTPGMRCRCP